MTRIGITIGDPSGIGPEIVAATLRERPALGDHVTIFGDAGVLRRAGLPLDRARTGGPAIVEVTRLAPEDALPGRPTRAGGAAQVAYLDAAIAAARTGGLDALVTAPISKTQAKAAGLAFPGHTELLAERLGAREHAMMFCGPRLRVVLATIHEPLEAVPRLLSRELVARAIVLGARALVRDLGVAAPRIGVLGLNPHAGEGGLFGREELDVIAPGIEDARARLAAEGLAAAPRVLEIVGPLVPDAAYRSAAGLIAGAAGPAPAVSTGTLSAVTDLPGGPGALPAALLAARNKRRSFDLFVAMYHDQALIPVKLVDFELAVNVTLGLPLVRTSPDHGVAYDIAGLGAPTVRHESFAAALDLATAILANRADQP